MDAADEPAQTSRTRRTAKGGGQIAGALFVSELVIPAVLLGALLAGWALYETLGIVAAVLVAGAAIMAGGWMWVVLRRRRIASLNDSFKAST